MKKTSHFLNITHTFKKQKVYFPKKYTVSKTALDIDANARHDKPTQMSVLLVRDFAAAKSKTNARRSGDDKKGERAECGKFEARYDYADLQYDEESRR